MKINMVLSKDLGRYMIKFKDTELSSIGFRICLSSVGFTSSLYRLAALSVVRSDLFTSLYIRSCSIFVFFFFIFGFQYQLWLAYPTYLCLEVQVAQNSLSS